jgi:predicted enzyme related to lactoylglutathione lyase
MNDPVLKIDYNELPVTDMAVAKTFYANAFGWKFIDYGPTYAAFENAGLDGGLRLDTATTRGGSLIILQADDLEAAEARVAKADGEIISRENFPGGRRFNFLDPVGNELAVWSPNGQYD